MESTRTKARRRWSWTRGGLVVAARTVLGGTVLGGTVLGGTVFAGVIPAGAVAAKLPSPTALYAKAMADAAGTTGVRVVGTISSNSYVQSAIEDADRLGGTVAQNITAGTARYSFEERLIGSTLYLNGDQDSLEVALQLDQSTAAFDAGYWRIVPVTSKYYESLAYGLNLTTQLALSAIGPPFTISGPVRYKGQPAYAISSLVGLHAGPGEAPLRGKYTLYVSTGAKPYPIGETGRVVIDSTAEVIVTDFSHWGEKVSVAVPKIVKPV